MSLDTTSSTTDAKGRRAAKTIIDRDRQEVVGRLVAAAPQSYAGALQNPAHRDDMVAHIDEAIDRIRDTLASGRPLARDDVAFVAPHIKRRVTGGISLDECLFAFRGLQRAVFDVVVDGLHDSPQARSAGVVTARALMDFVDVASAVATEVYIETEAAMASRGGSVRRDLLESLLAARPIGSPDQMQAARACGLLDTACFVLTATARGALGDAAPLHRASSTLARALGLALEPLALVYQDDIVIVAPSVGSSEESLAARVRSARDELQAASLDLAVGISTVYPDLAGVPAAYAEAGLAARHAIASGIGCVVLSDVRLLDFLTLAPAQTAQRLIPEAVRDFGVDESATGRELVETLLAYFDCGLSAKGTAALLEVHTNTVHYRLARIAERTGYDTHIAADVVNLVIAVRLLRGGTRQRPS